MNRNLIDAFRRAVAEGTEYGNVVGHISGIVRPGPYGAAANWTDAEKLAEIGRVLDALDAAQREENTR